MGMCGGGQYWKRSKVERWARGEGAMALAHPVQWLLLPAGPAPPLPPCACLGGLPRLVNG